MPVQIIQAIGIPRLYNEVNEIKVRNFAEKFYVPVNEIKRRQGPNDVLVGINYPKIYVGKTKVRDAFVARNSSLG